jgi:hypothetical protein
MAEHRPDVAREAPEWMYPYLAGMMDSSGAANVAVSKSQTAPVGYTIHVRVQFQSAFEVVIGMIDEIAEAHNWSSGIDSTEGAKKYRLSISTRQDITELLTLVEPFIVGRLEQVRLLLDVILPALGENAHHQKESFVELMEAVDEFRAASSRKAQSKYDSAYFRDLWDLN